MGGSLCRYIPEKIRRCTVSHSSGQFTKRIIIRFLQFHIPFSPQYPGPLDTGSPYPEKFPRIFPVILDRYEMVQRLVPPVIVVVFHDSGERLCLFRQEYLLEWETTRSKVLLQYTMILWISESSTPAGAESSFSLSVIMLLRKFGQMDRALHSHRNELNVFQGQYRN